MEYLKCHGTGNMFYLIDELEREIILEEMKADFVRSVCEMDKELDGVLFVVKGDKHESKMRIFNVDGTEPEMCGNGLRCAARYAGEKLGKKEFIMETLKEEYRIKIEDGEIENLLNVSIEIRGITTDLKEIPLNKDGEVFINRGVECFNDDLKYSAFSISNPHLVTISEDVAFHKMERLGKIIIEDKDVFPEGINLSFLREIGEEEVFVRTFERGVGFTKSCGTGMMSATTNYCINNDRMFERDINVYNDGGKVNIQISRDGKDRYKAIFKGNATYVERGEVVIEGEIVAIHRKLTYDREKIAYMKLLELKSYKTEMVNNN